MRSLLAAAADTESAQVPEVSVFGGFAYADVPEAGFSVVGVTDRSLADETRTACADLADGRERRHEFDREYTSVEAATAGASDWDATDGPLLRGRLRQPGRRER